MSSLPPVLAARLAKRGFINSNNNKSSFPQQKPKEENKNIVVLEEVIAEDYDDVQTKHDESDIELKTIETVRGCPNKYNIYHNCTNFCLKQYGNVSEEPSKRLRKQFTKLLEKFPLNDSCWEQVYEPGLQTFYFWNVETDQVSWLPPNHPDAKISMSAEKLRRLIRDDHEVEENNDTQTLDREQDEDSETDDDDDSDLSDRSDSDDGSSSSDDDDRKQSMKLKRLRMIEKQNKLDPMDPASYSNIPRGKWSDGLR